MASMITTSSAESSPIFRCIACIADLPSLSFDELNDPYTHFVQHVQGNRDENQRHQVGWRNDGCYHHNDDESMFAVSQ